MTLAVNWNRLQDPIDKEVWDRLTSNFWLDTKIPVSNDRATWAKMTPEEQLMVKRVFASLTTLDTLQSTTGAPILMRHATTPHEEAVFANICFMEAVHAKSYSTIFSTLCSTEEIDELFRWAATDELLTLQVDTIEENYSYGDALTSALYSVLLESFLFYTGFYAPLRLAAEGKLTNTADIIRLILRDEGVHGFYIGYKFQKVLELDVPEERREVALHEAYIVLQQLYETELKRVEQIYDPVGWSEEVKPFLRYNANKALANLGLDPMFEPEDTEIPSYILAALDPGTGESHDFFSGAGASYVIGQTEETEEEDWSW